MSLRPLFPALAGVLAAILSGCGGGGGGGYYRPYDRPDNGSFLGNSSQTLTCESEDGGNRSCRANMRIGRAEIDKRLSGAPCQEGRTWGYSDNRIWVDRGCRARFRVYPAGSSGGGYGGDGGSSILRCESDNGRRRRCDAGFNIQRLVLERQLSDTRCVKGSTFGNDGRGVWVDGGCRGDFRVYRR